MTIQALNSRSWNGTPISRRTTDGYVNATAMCKANEKRWKDYRESDRCQQYLDAVESVAGISVHALVESRSGGAGGGSTWVHPQVAVDLARWISAPFAVWMDAWFLEELAGGRVSQVRETPAPALPGDVLTMVERSISLLERLGGVDDRSQMLLRDVVLNATLNAASGSAPQLGLAKELTISEFLIELGCPSHKATQVATQIGRNVKKVYRTQNGRDPKSQDQLVGGRRCSVALYERDWLIQNESSFQEAIEQIVGS